MDALFVYVRKDGTPSQPVNLSKVMDSARGRIDAGGGPFDVTQDGDVLHGDLTSREALTLLRNRLEHGDIGPVYRVRTRDLGVVFAAREATPAAKLINTNGNAKIDRVWSYIKANYPNATFLGAYVCKDIAGTSTLSQHSYGNAIDAGNVDLVKLAEDLVAHADELDLEHVIVHNRIWTRGQGWHAYTGEYHYHVHADCAPNLSGPCGVRN